MFKLVYKPSFSVIFIIYFIYYVSVGVIFRFTPWV